MKFATLGMIAYCLGAILALLVFASLSVPAEAQTLRHCAPRDVVLDRLIGKYGETRRSFGMAANGSVMEVFASASSGTWTITVTMPSGTTYEELSLPLPPEGDAL